MGYPTKVQLIKRKQSEQLIRRKDKPSQDDRDASNSVVGKGNGG